MERTLDETREEINNEWCVKTVVYEMKMMTSPSFRRRQHQASLQESEVAWRGQKLAKNEHIVHWLSVNSNGDVKQNSRKRKNFSLPLEHVIVDESGRTWTMMSA